MALQIKIGERRRGPSERPPPGERRGTRIVATEGSDPPRELPVYLARAALESMRARARAAGELEVGGFLVGGYHHYYGRRYVEVEVEVPALEARSARTHLTFDNETLREFHRTLDARHPGKLVVGWYHTHPGYGVFLSAHDLFIHERFYGAEHHVAVVVEPVAHEVGVFVREGGRVAGPHALVVYEPEEP